jgi:hypothetical protein
MVIYLGDMSPGAIFDPAMLSAVPGQVKFKSQADTSVEQAIQPIGLPRNLCAPLPYLAVPFELGNKSYHGATKSKIKATTPSSPMVEFQALRENWEKAGEALESYLKEHPKAKHKDPLSKLYYE